MTRSTQSAFAELQERDPGLAAPARFDAGDPGGPAGPDADAERLLRSIIATPRHLGLAGDGAGAHEPVMRQRAPRGRHASARSVIGIAAAVLVIASVVTVATSTIQHGSRAQGVGGTGTGAGAHVVPAPRWQVAAALTGPAFNTGSGNPNGLSSAQCVSETLCFLTTGYGTNYDQGGSLYVSHDGGHTWAPVALPADTEATTQVSCASATWCAVGAGLLDPSTGDPLAQMPSRDPELLVSSDGGQSWSVRSVPLAVAVMDIPASTRFPAETTYWPGEVSAVSCGAPGSCVVLGEVSSSTGAPGYSGLVAVRTTDGGTQWTSAALPEQATEAGGQIVGASMQCPTSSSCVVVATLYFRHADLWRTTDGGQTWQESQVPGTATGAQAPMVQLRCPDAQACWLLTSGSRLLRSVNGGATWSTVLQDHALDHALYSAVTAQGCSSSTTCLVATGGLDQAPHLLQTDDGGRHWQGVALPSNANLGSVAQLSCNAREQCIGIGTVGQIINSPATHSVILTNFPNPAS